MRLSGGLLNLSASISQHGGQYILRHHLVNLSVHVMSAISACCYHDHYRRVREDEDFIPAISAAIESLISFGVNSVIFIPPQIAIAIVIGRGLFALLKRFINPCFRENLLTVPLACIFVQLPEFSQV